MPRPRNPFPTLRKHSDGSAVATFYDAVDGRKTELRFGPFGSKEAQANFDQEVTRWVSAGRRLPKDDEASELTNNELCVAFLEANLPRFETRSSSGHVENFKSAIRVLRTLLGDEPARDMSPKRLKRVRSEMVQRGWVRRHVNAQVGRLKQIYRWGVGEELLPPSVSHGLASVRALEIGEEAAKEKEKVKPVADEVVERTLPLLPRMVQDIVRLLRLCGCRCGELVQLRPVDLDTSRPTWEFKPVRHKTLKKGRDRFVYFGPEAQSILSPWLAGLKGDQYVFSPGRSEELRNEERGEKRRTKRWPSHRRRNAEKRKRVRKKSYAVHYETHAIGVAIRRACNKIDEAMRRARNPGDDRKSGEVPRADRLFPAWGVHQLRHAAGTRIRKRFGVETARIILGHAKLDTTEIYAEVDREAAMEAMRELG